MPTLPTPRRPVRILAAAVLAVALCPAPPVGADDGATVVQRLLDSRADAVVTIDAVVRTEFQMGGQGDDQENSVSMSGVVVDPEGLVMVWNSRVSSSRVQEMMELMSGATGQGDDFGMRMTPLSFEVHLPGREEPVSAFLAASDPRLDVAFLQIDEPPAEPLPHVDLSQAVEPRVGQAVYGVDRLSDSFDHAPFVATGRVVGTLRKPRPAWIVEGDLQGLGLPVFDAEGRPVGVLTTVLSSVAAERSASMFQGMGGFLNPGDGKTMGPLGVFLLAAPPVARAVELSKEQARERLEERRAAGDGAGEAEQQEEEEDDPGAEPEDGEAAGESEASDGR